MQPQKTFDDTTFAARQIEALEPLINMAYKDFFNGSVLGQNLEVFLAFIVNTQVTVTARVCTC